jgi:hypothetical protein
VDASDRDDDGAIDRRRRRLESDARDVTERSKRDPSASSILS